MPNGYQSISTSLKRQYPIQVNKFPQMNMVVNLIKTRHAKVNCSTGDAVGCTSWFVFEDCMITLRTSNFLIHQINREGGLETVWA